MTRRTAASLLACAMLAAGAQAPASTARPTGAAALARLQAGNARFAADAAAGQPIGRARRVELAKGQAPFATVLSCADSRVPPEVVFNTGLGDLFVVRAAGQVADRSVVASVEYALEHLHTPLLVVMGHEACGAVQAAADAQASLGPNLDYLVAAIRPAVRRARAAGGAEWIHAAVLGNVEDVINTLLARSQVVSHLAGTGEVDIVGAVYELESGRVRFSRVVDASHRAAHAAGGQ